MNCSIAKALDQVGEWWSLLIIRECSQGAARFDEIQSELGIARNILTNRLERLVQLGILERFSINNRTNTDGYRLTEKGEDLYPVLIALMQWGGSLARQEGYGANLIGRARYGKGRRTNSGAQQIWKSAFVSRRPVRRRAWCQRENAHSHSKKKRAHSRRTESFVRITARAHASLRRIE
ncbi:helix-turn-helix domain-containing protein [Paraburkholderia bengalensis]|uniref:winged helix-turn-helix transcriptional regulator n=1 Tax=Paraburkholderia bengalensis TaxID=2747562 RepID=UPI003014DA3A